MRPGAHVGWAGADDRAVLLRGGCRNGSGGDAGLSGRGEGGPAARRAAGVQAQLNAAGIAEVEHAGLCTACHVDEFYSHRAEHGHAGRFGIAMGIRG